MHRRSPVLIGLGIAMTIVCTSTAVYADDDDDDHGDEGFITAHPAMVTPVRAGVEVTPLLTVGDTLDDGYRFEAIPDGIAVRRRNSHRAEVYVNHETARVPFPYNTAAPTAANGENDFNNAQVSKLVVDTRSIAIDEGSYAIDSDLGYQRFCSNFLATRAEGFDRDILFTSEESPDYVFRQEDSWPPPLDSPDQREVGVVVALDVKTGESRPIYGMGRHNHENAVAIPGYRKPVVLSGDDTFTSGPLTIPAGGPNTETSAAAQSQLYSYIARDTRSLLRDQGELWAFVADDPAVDDYYDFTPGSTASVSGHFIQVPKEIATGIKADGTEVHAADFGYPAPPTDGSWQRDLRSLTPLGVDGPQWVLQYWSDLNNVFQFVRVEDIAYDKRPGMGNTVYVVDSGRGTAGTPQAGRSTNGRVWKLVFDQRDPTVVTSMSIIVDGDDSPVKTAGEVHQPDNIETTRTGLLLTEDPGSSQQFPVTSTDPAATTGRLWYVPFAGTPEVVLKVDQSADGGPTDVDGRAPGNLGAWETSGIVDASEAFGPGAYLIDVQAHTLWVERAPGDDNNGDGAPDFTYKREGGQLILVRIPGI